MSRRAQKPSHFAGRVPKQYANPYRRTAFLFDYPVPANGGFIDSHRGERFAHILNYNQQHDPALSDLYSRNLVTESQDRVKDARAMDYHNPITQGFYPY